MRALIHGVKVYVNGPTLENIEQEVAIGFEDNDIQSPKPSVILVWLIMQNDRAVGGTQESSLQMCQYNRESMAMLWRTRLTFHLC